MMSVIRQARNKLEQGLKVPGTGRSIRVFISGRAIPGDPIAGAVLARHAKTLVERVPELVPFYHPSIGASPASTLAFLNFANGFVPMIRSEAHEPRLRSLLVHLREQVENDEYRDLLTREIAKSDLRNGLPERSTVLLDDEQTADYLRAQIEEADRLYESEAPLIAARDTWLSLPGDPRGESVLALLKARAESLRGMSILHIAPESAVRDWFSLQHDQLGVDYRTFDAFDSSVDLRGDLTALAVGDASFDLILCHRVLEHILDDRTALAHLFRVLHPGGELSISVPQTMGRPTSEWLIEDESHHGHVRHYGGDFEQLLHATGFEVTVERMLLDRSLEQHIEHGTYPMRIYRAVKPRSL
jgi:SAM-dependent methyltransferase